MSNEMLWLPVEYLPHPIAGLAFANVWICGDYVIGPTAAPENISQYWTLDYGTAEIGRYATVQEARDAAEDHQRRLS